MIGETLGQYRLTRELGKGGFATVYQSLHPFLNRLVAVKVLHPEFIREERTRSRFKREALAIGKLNHPNIVHVYDGGEHEGRLYLVMEFVAGKTLKERLGKPATLAFTLEVIAAVGAALDYAHAHGIVHRDVKPANILLTDDDRILLSDFGIVRLADSEVGDNSLTRGVIGTPYYMSPEQALGHEVDGRSDLYSLGVVLYEMLTGRVPYKGDSAVATLSMHATLPVPSPRDHNPAVPLSVDRVAQRALAKAPQDRYQSGAQLQAALAAAIAEAAAPPEPTIRVPASAAAPPVEPAGLLDLDMAYRQLVEFVRVQNWRSAVNLAAQILAQDANYRDVSTILASATNELRLRGGATSESEQIRALLDQADAAVASGQLMKAASILQQLIRTSPHDAQARARLDEVNRLKSEEENQRRRQTRLERLYALAQSKMRSGDWRWACNILDEINSVQPDYQDVPQLIVQARAELRAAEAEAQPAADLATLRDRAEAAMAASRWPEALSLWQEVERREPGLPGVAERIEVSQYQTTLATINTEAARLTAAGQWQQAIEKLEEIKALGPIPSL